MKLTAHAIAARLADTPGWRLVDDHHLERTFEFADFATALVFVNAVGQIAEDLNHHPDILLSWGKAVVSVWSHDVSGITDRDFALAEWADRASKIVS